MNLISRIKKLFSKEKIEPTPEPEIRPEELSEGFIILHVDSDDQIFIDCDIEVERFISRTFALGAQLLRNEELKSNTILIDLGFNKISMGLFKNFALVHSITFPFGIGFITKDISKVCSLDLEESDD